MTAIVTARVGAALGGLARKLKGPAEAHGLGAEGNALNEAGGLDKKAGDILADLESQFKWVDEA